MPETPPIRVFLVDDHRVVRSGVSAYLSFIPDIEVIGEAAGGNQALDRLTVLAANGALPGVVMMDLLMPDRDGVEVIAEIRARWPTVQVVAMTSYSDESKIRETLNAGAAGYLLKDSDATAIAEAIRGAIEGRVHLDPTVARVLTDGLRAGHRRGDDLTARERQVLDLLAGGASNQEIADALVVSERTARTHVSSILAKLDFPSRTQAALWAARAGYGQQP